MDNEKMRLLTRPFSDIKSRPGRNGQAIQYVEGHAIVQRLNEALGGDWSFKVLEHDVREGEVIVLGELRAGDLVKQAFGGSEVTRTRDGKVVSLADDLKSAATDALKKAATLLGVALQLYGVERAAGDAQCAAAGATGAGRRRARRAAGQSADASAGRVHRQAGPRQRPQQR